jgi:hypothetical protein
MHRMGNEGSELQAIRGPAIGPLARQPGFRRLSPFHGAPAATPACLVPRIPRAIVSREDAKNAKNVNGMVRTI